MSRTLCFFAFSCIFALFSATHGQDDGCDLDSKITCTTSLLSCGNGLVYEEGATICNKCPGCVKYACGYNEACCEEKNKDGLQIGEFPIIKYECAPGLECSAGKCKPPINPLNRTCSTYHYLNYIGYDSTCLPDGSFAPVQSKGGNDGRRFCYTEDGRRIFGQQWADRAENMTCACSLEVEKLKETRSDISLHCTEEGNYEELQCDDGICWCAGEKTGESKYAVVPESLWTLLPCYNGKIIGSQYLRQCESTYISQQRIVEALQKHGTKAEFGFMLCDPDGSYGSKAVEDMCYCRWKDNTNIESFFTENSDADNVDCNCARDRKYYEEAEKTTNLKCKGNGNYEPIQQGSNGKYCVDADGYPTIEYDENTKCDQQ